MRALQSGDPRVGELVNLHPEISIAVGPPSASGIRSPSPPPPTSLFQLPSPLRWQLLSVMVVIVVEAVAATLPLPFVGLFVSYLAKTPVDDAGYISGYLVAAYFLGQVLSGSLWGRASDRFGRRLVLLVGLASGATLSFLFGLSTSVFTAIGIRFLQGIGNGNIVVAKTVVADITDDWSEGVGFASISLFWSLGSILGPVIGGLLYDPSSQELLSFVDWGGQGRFWSTYPALLPCAVLTLASAFAGLWTMMCLKESVPRPKRHIPSHQRHEPRTPIDLSSIGTAKVLDKLVPRPSTASATEHSEYGFRDAFRCSETRNAVILYMCLSACENGTMEVLPLWAIAPKSVGGLNFTSSTLGTLLMCSSIFCIGGNIMFERVSSWLQSNRRHWDASTLVWIATLVVQPLASQIDSASTAYMFTTTMSSIREVVISWDFSMSYVMTARCAPKEHIGALNGIAQACGSLSRMVFLVIVPPIFAWSLDSSMGFPCNHHLAFIVVALPLVLTIILSRRMQYFS